MMRTPPKFMVGALYITCCVVLLCEVVGQNNVDHPQTAGSLLESELHVSTSLPFDELIFCTNHESSGVCLQEDSSELLTALQAICEGRVGGSCRANMLEAMANDPTSLRVFLKIKKSAAEFSAGEEGEKSMTGLWSVFTNDDGKKKIIDMIKNARITVNFHANSLFGGKSMVEVLREANSKTLLNGWESGHLTPDTAFGERLAGAESKLFDFPSSPSDKEWTSRPVYGLVDLRESKSGAGGGRECRSRPFGDSAGCSFFVLNDSVKSRMTLSPFPVTKLNSIKNFAVGDQFDAFLAPIAREYDLTFMMLPALTHSNPWYSWDRIVQYRTQAETPTMKELYSSYVQAQIWGPVFWKEDVAEIHLDKTELGIDGDYKNNGVTLKIPETSISEKTEVLEGSCPEKETWHDQWKAFAKQVNAKLVLSDRDPPIDYPRYGNAMSYGNVGLGMKPSQLVANELEFRGVRNTNGHSTDQMPMTSGESKRA